ncbi:MerR family transcriptional regulator [Clostridiales bacterium COT073_COT-073]|nr:MerR family transcriptional regulator [Clostridiales bacterium COT073_COT-073]
MSKQYRDKYLIGDVSKICNISKKTLRYYDDIDVIKPEHISEYNSYRYYSMDNMHDIMILKYFKQMGYSLSEIRENFNSYNYDYILESLKEKANELREERRKIENKIKAAMDWKLLIDEAALVIQFKDEKVIVKEIEERSYPSLKQEFKYCYKESIINIPWVKLLELSGEEITGPVILKFNSYQDKISCKINTATIFQKGLNDVEEGIGKINFGGQFLSTYHIGSFEEIEKAYKRIEEFAKENNYTLKGESYERYVVDYWTTQEKSLFVTEVLMPIAREELS